jgi:hypothetical protein
MIEGGGAGAKRFADGPATVTQALRPESISGPEIIPGIISRCETVGGTEWYIVEYEVAGVPALEAVARCLDGLRKLGRA